jgi:phage terminase large subunit GpA-like protein
MDVLGPWNNKHLWEHQNPKKKIEQWSEIMAQMNIDYAEIIKTKQDLTTDFEIIMDTISRNKYNTLNSFLNYTNRETLFTLRQKENDLERRIQESAAKYPTRSRPSIVLQHEELDNWDDDDSVV